MSTHAETLAEIDAALALISRLSGGTSVVAAREQVVVALRKARALIPGPPTGDEREYVAELLDADSCWEYNGNHTTFRPLLGADAILDAGFRRHALSPVTDAERKLSSAMARVETLSDHLGIPYIYEPGHDSVRDSMRSRPVTDAEVEAAAWAIRKDDPAADAYGFEDYRNMARAALEAARKVPG